MFRLLVTALAMSFVCGLSANGAQMSCPRTIITCQSPCASSQSDTNLRCGPICRTTVVFCDPESKQAATSHLPDSELPADQLPQTRLPNSRLPDSVLN